MVEDGGNRHLREDMTVALERTVRGHLYTSTVGLGVVIAVVLGVALAAMRGMGIVHSTNQSVILWVMCTVLLTAMLQIAVVATVSSEGFRVASFGREVWIPWSNVSRIEAGVLGAKFIFKEPQAIGSKARSKYAFTGFDPMWRKRPTSVAIAAHLAEAQSGP
jgi:hypothetical protein